MMSRNTWRKSMIDKSVNKWQELWDYLIEKDNMEEKFKWQN